MNTQITDSEKCSTEKLSGIAERNSQFVLRLIKRCQNDTGFRAAMRQASRPNREYHSYPYFVRFGIDISKQQQRLPYALIASSAAYSKQQENGTLLFAKALALCFPEANQSDPALMRLRRILSCSDITELCGILRPLLMFIHSRINGSLDYVALLNDLTMTHLDVLKRNWAQQFYQTENHAAHNDEQQDFTDSLSGEEE